MATWTQLSFQDASSPLMEQLIFFHDYAMTILVAITMLVGYMILTLIFNMFSHRFLNKNQSIEIIWTIIPSIILIFLALPSLQLLYLMEENLPPIITIKIIGHQWYWSFEYSDFEDFKFESYIVPLNNSYDNFRLIDVTNRLVIPHNMQLRLMITAADVLHSWSLPALGIKVDAVPGRLSQLTFLINRPGVYFGQCSEICGANHSFMPIAVESISIESFLTWVNKMN